MLSSQTEKQLPAGGSVQEADLLRRSKKKTKRGLAERDEDPMVMEEESQETQMDGKDTPAIGQTEQNSQPATRRPLGDKYGSWMIATRKPRNYQNTSDPRRNNGKNQNGKNDNTKGKTGGNQGNRGTNFNKEGSKIWNNSRFGALENLEEESEDDAQEENVMTDIPEGPTGTTLSGKGKRPQTQVTEAQILNDKTAPRRVSTTEKRPEKNTRADNRVTEGNKKQGNQAAQTENHTVVRGYDKGSRVVRTMITEEGSSTEEFHTPPEIGDHHQDPPDPNEMSATDEPGDPMAGVESVEDQSAGLGAVSQ
nr:uncharacterized protein LOC109158743 [Ipomoea batatas]